MYRWTSPPQTLLVNTHTKVNIALDISNLEPEDRQVIKKPEPSKKSKYDEDNKPRDSPGSQVLMSPGEKAMMARMEKTMQSQQKAHGVSQDEINRLPKPKELLGEASGPVHLRNKVEVVMEDIGNKLIVVSRTNSGYPVLGQFLTKEAGFFEHSEPPSNPHVVTNLLNCVLVSDLVDNFAFHTRSSFGASPYFKKECLLDSKAVCSDPISYEKSCRKFPNQVIKTANMSLKVVEKLLAENEDLKVIFLVRDPRGVLATAKLSVKPAKVCSELNSDLDASLNLMALFPKQFALAKYEALAANPLDEVSKLLENLNIEVAIKTESLAEAWSKENNSASKINSWKQSLPIVELNKIENRCLESLSKMEYQLIGTGVG